MDRGADFFKLARIDPPFAQHTFLGDRENKEEEGLEPKENGCCKGKINFFSFQRIYQSGGISILLKLLRMNLYKIELEYL